MTIKKRLRVPWICKSLIKLFVKKYCKEHFSKFTNILPNPFPFPSYFAKCFSKDFFTAILISEANVFLGFFNTLFHENSKVKDISKTPLKTIIVKSEDSKQHLRRKKHSDAIFDLFWKYIWRSLDVFREKNVTTSENQFERIHSEISGRIFSVIPLYKISINDFLEGLWGKIWI